MTLRRDLFLRHVKDALANFYDPIRLQTHPLVAELGPSETGGETAAEYLRKLLLEAIESLRPADSIPPGRREWLSYRLLWLHYVQAQDLAGICRELGLSQRSFYRRQKEAVEAVASILWERYRQEAAGSDNRGQDLAALSSSERAREEALKLARRANRQLVDLCGLIGEVRETISPLTAKLGIELLIETPASLPLAYGDPAVFHQIVLNLLTEALNLVSGSTLRLVVGLGEGDRRLRGPRPTSPRPISPKTLWQIMGLGHADRVRPGLEEATGFMVSQSLLDAYGGRLWVQTDERGRAVICFSVPVAKPEAILVVDDDAETIALYRRYLENQEYVVRGARNKDQVEAEMARSLPDLVLLDVLMPQEDGWGLMRYLKARPETAQIPIVICSVLSQPRLALALGAVRVLQKPISEQLLIQTVQSVLRQGDSPPQARQAETART